MVNGSNNNTGGGIKGFFLRCWYLFVVTLFGIKWSMRETFTRHRKIDWSNVQDRRGEIAVITGGARGIGVEVVKILLKAEMSVFIGCRKVSAGEAAVTKIRNEGIATGSATVLELDLMSLDSVRAFAAEVLRRTSSVHVLINNAGIMACPFQMTPDGFESQLQVNYLSHFLLTERLYPAIVHAGLQNKCSRIVNVSSIAHYGGSVNFNDINMESMYSPFKAYMASKLMQVISTVDLNARLKINSHSTRAYAVHPGMVWTELYEHMPVVKMLSFFLKPFYKTPAQGADGVAYAALSKDIENDGGIFLANCQKFNPNRKATDRDLQLSLTEVSFGLVGSDSTSTPHILLKRAISKQDIEIPFFQNRNEAATDVVVDMDNP